MALGFKQFLVELITPERADDPLECGFASLPAWDGQVGILANRAPMVCRLAPGPLTVEVGGRRRRYYVQGGFARVADNVVTVLAERLVPEADLTMVEVDELLDRARKMDARGEPARRTRRTLIARARALRAMIHRRDQPKT